MGLDIRGCGTALVTPFAKDGSLDVEALRRLVQFQIREGIDFLVPCGTTGETPTLEPEEYLGVIRVVVEEAAGKVRAGASFIVTGTINEQNAGHTLVKDFAEAVHSAQLAKRKS